MDTMNESRFALAELPACLPTPGGGGTAALVGAAGAALGNMVGCLTVGKRSIRRGSGPSTLNERAGALRGAEAPAGGCRSLCAAGRRLWPAQGHSEQAAHKAAVLETALDAACAVPLEIMGKCAEGIALVEEYAAGAARVVAKS